MPIAPLRLLAPLFLVVVAACGGGETAAAVRDDTREAFAELQSILADVVDEESAKAAKPRIEAFARRIDSIDAREMELSDRERQKLAKMQEGLQRDFREAFDAEMQRILTDPELALHLTAVLMALADS